MIRIIEERIFEGAKKYIEAAGTSLDSKPTANIVTGSLFLEADTGDAYIFYEDSTTPAWTKIGG